MRHGRLGRGAGSLCGSSLQGACRHVRIQTKTTTESKETNRALVQQEVFTEEELSRLLVYCGGGCGLRVWLRRNVTNGPVNRSAPAAVNAHSGGRVVRHSPARSSWSVWMRPQKYQ